MNLRESMCNVLIQRLDRNWEDGLLGGWDEERRAELREYSRGVVYSAAYGIWGDLPGSPIKGDQRIWGMVCKMFDRVCDWQLQSGEWPMNRKHIEQIPSTIGYVWHMSSLLRFYERFGARLEPQLRDKMQAMLRKAMLLRMTIANSFLTRGSIPGRNLVIAYAYELWQAGSIFGEQDWQSLGTQVIEAIIASQAEAGFYPDHIPCRAPTTGYSAVTLRTVAAYALHSGSKFARESVKRASDYHFAFSYPNAACIETIDERQAHTDIVESLIWALAPFDETREHAAFVLDALLKRGKAGRYAATCIELDAWEATTSGEVKIAEQPQGAVLFPTLPAMTLRKKPWFFCLSGVTAAEPSGPHRMDLQNHVSIWHDNAGLFVGGGGSISNPMYSTFRFRDRYLADSGKVEPRDNGGVVRLAYGNITGVLDLAVLDANTLRIRAHAEGALPPGSEFAVTFFEPRGKKIKIWKQEQEVGDMSIYGDFWPEMKGSFTLDRVTLSVQHNATVMWPCLRANPYRLPEYWGNSAVMRVWASLCDGPAEFTITVAAEK